MPPSPSGASATNSAAASSTPSSLPNNDSRILALGVTLAVIGVLLIGGIIYMTFRFQRRSQSQSDSPNSSDQVVDRPGPSYGTSLSRDHFAARITPFGSLSGEAPRFAHRPGENMRIARRRSDGAWQFFDPRTPVSPGSPNDYDPLPSPAPSAMTFNTMSSGHPLLQSNHGHLPLAMSAKEREAQLYSERAYAQHQLGLPDSDYVVEEAPPPAYVYDNHTVVRGLGRTANESILQSPQ